MGRMIESVALSRGHEIVCIIDAQPIPCPSLNGKKIFTPDKGFASEAFCSADVAIEFSRPEAAERNIRAALAQGVPVVCGTTGWDVEGLKATLKPSNPQTLKPSNPQTLKPSTLNEHPGVIWSSNYSVGVNILFAVNKYLAQLLQRAGGYTPSITEVHHIHKLDAPSGTAKTLAEAINSQPSNSQTLKPSNLNCPIESIREGEVPGIHEVRWESEVDILTLRHEAKSRQGFALGAVLAAEWLRGKTGWHSMAEVMGLNI